MNKWMHMIAVTLALAVQASAESIELKSLTPNAAQVGMVVINEDKTSTDVPDKVNFGSYVNNTGWWKDHRKVVSEVPADFALAANEPYRSQRQDAFVVTGEAIDGVGLWAKAPSMYHWVEYTVPAGAKRLTGRVLFTDDPLGNARGYRKTTNQNGTFYIQIDGSEAMKKDFLRANVADGSGEKWIDLDVAIPQGAQTIRLRMQHSAWGDGNTNTELVLNQTKFQME